MSSFSDFDDGDALRRVMDEAGAELSRERSLVGRIRSLEEALREARAALLMAEAVLWMAENYAEAGGTGGPEMRDYRGVPEAVNAALARIDSLLAEPTEGDKP